MINLDPALGLQEQKSEIECTARTIISKQQHEYGVTAHDLSIAWEEGTSDTLSTVARVNSDILYLNTPLLVTIPYYNALRETLVSLEIGTPEGKKSINLPYGKLIDWLWLGPHMKCPIAGEIKALSRAQMCGEIARALTEAALKKLDGWLASNHSDALCIRKGIVDVYESIFSMSTPTLVSERIWNLYDTDVRSWRESSGGYHLLAPYLISYFTCNEVIKILSEAGPPMRHENLPTYFSRVFALL